MNNHTVNKHLFFVARCSCSQQMFCHGMGQTVSYWNAITGVGHELCAKQKTMFAHDLMKQARMQIKFNEINEINTRVVIKMFQNESAMRADSFACFMPLLLAQLDCNGSPWCEPEKISAVISNTIGEEIKLVGQTCAQNQNSYTYETQNMLGKNANMFNMLSRSCRRLLHRTPTAVHWWRVPCDCSSFQVCTSAGKSEKIQPASHHHSQNTTSNNKVPPF